MIKAGQGLAVGGKIVSTHGRFQLVFQADGNLVLYGPSGQRLWASATSITPWQAVMQSDGNFVIYNMQGRAL